MQAAPLEVYNYPQLSLGCLHSALGERYAISSVVNCLLLAIAPVWLSKSCVRYVIRGARAREMNKHQRGCAGSGKNEADK